MAAELGGRRVMIVTDPGILAAGHVTRGVNALEAAGLTVGLFHDVAENPTTAHVDAGVAFARDFAPDLIVGFGGGSSMDCAKGINFLITNGGAIRDYWGIGKATKPLLPMIAVPTTAGTGSEAQSFALISDADTHVKMACGDKKASFRTAVLDPTLTVTQPSRVTALTGVDALSHAVESYVTLTRNAASSLFAGRAFELLAKNLPLVLNEPENLAARGAMQVGACFAGLAIENGMLGAAHALANPLTAEFGIVHGQAIGLVLPAVVRFNGAHVDELYRSLLAVARTSGDLPAASGGAAAMSDFLTMRIAQSGLKTKLHECDVPRDVLPRLAADAATQWTAKHNPRPVETADLLSIYEAAW
ncbi:MAG: iron-containing alcohol dehydrogenase [Pirellulales bacterium]